MYHQITWHPFIAFLFSTQVEDTDVHSNVDVTPDPSSEERASETEVEWGDLEEYGYGNERCRRDKIR